MNVYEASIGGKLHKIEVETAASSESAAPHRPSASLSGEIEWIVRLDGREIAVSCVPLGANALSLIVNGESFDVQYERSGDNLRVFVRGIAYECSVRDPRSLRSRKRSALSETGEQEVTASMPGKVVRITASVGDRITAGQGILVIEAMKMQNEVRSPKDGLLKNIIVRQGANVVAGEVLAIIE